MTSAPSGFSSPLRRMTGRAIDEEHRVATPLELLFDLAFVVAIAAAALHLREDVAAHLALADTLKKFALSFFAIWWAWMNYTWFASAYDTDDVAFRLLTMVQMGGAVLLAVGIEQFHGLLDGPMIAGYVIMRCALVVQWLRAAHGAVDQRRNCLRYAAGISVMQVAWVALYVLTRAGHADYVQWLVVFAVLGEVLVPMWAEHAGVTPWHPHHIAERYGAMVIIVLGESVLGLVQALNNAIEAQVGTLDVALVGISTLAIVFGFWWLYFLGPYGKGLEQRRNRAFPWGYMHYGIFGSLAALGAGLALAAHAIEPESDISVVRVAWAIVIPMVAFAACKYFMHAALWGRDTRYDQLQGVLLVLLGIALGAAYLGASIPTTLALLMLVPVVTVATVELLNQHGDRGWRMTKD